MESLRIIVTIELVFTIALGGVAGALVWTVDPSSIWGACLLGGGFMAGLAFALWALAISINGWPSLEEGDDA